MAKGAIIEGEARYTTTTDQRSKDAPPLPAMTKAEWQAQLTDKKGMNNGRAKALVAEGIKSGRLKKPAIG